MQRVPSRARPRATAALPRPPTAVVPPSAAVPSRPRPHLALAARNSGSRGGTSSSGGAGAGGSVGVGGGSGPSRGVSPLRAHDVEAVIVKACEAAHRGQSWERALLLLAGGVALDHVPSWRAYRAVAAVLGAVAPVDVARQAIVYFGAGAGARRALCHVALDHAGEGAKAVRLAAWGLAPLLVTPARASEVLLSAATSGSVEPADAVPLAVELLQHRHASVDGGAAGRALASLLVLEAVHGLRGYPQAVDTLLPAALQSLGAVLRAHPNPLLAPVAHHSLACIARGPAQDAALAYVRAAGRRGAPQSSPTAAAAALLLLRAAPHLRSTALAALRRAASESKERCATAQTPEAAVCAALCADAAAAAAVHIAPLAPMGIARTEAFRCFVVDTCAAVSAAVEAAGRCPSDTLAGRVARRTATRALERCNESGLAFAEALHLTLRHEPRRRAALCTSAGEVRRALVDGLPRGAVGPAARCLALLQSAPVAELILASTAGDVPPLAADGLTAWCGAALDATAPEDAARCLEFPLASLVTPAWWPPPRLAARVARVRAEAGDDRESEAMEVGVAHARECFVSSLHYGARQSGGWAPAMGVLASLEPPAADHYRRTLVAIAAKAPHRRGRTDLAAQFVRKLVPDTAAPPTALELDAAAALASLGQWHQAAAVVARHQATPTAPVAASKPWWELTPAEVATARHHEAAATLHGEATAAAGRALGAVVSDAVRTGCWERALRVLGPAAPPAVEARAVLAQCQGDVRSCLETLATHRSVLLAATTGDTDPELAAGLTSVVRETLRRAALANPDLVCDVADEAVRVAPSHATRWESYRRVASHKRVNFKPALNSAALAGLVLRAVGVAEANLDAGTVRHGTKALLAASHLIDVAPAELSPQSASLFAAAAADVAAAGDRQGRYTDRVLLAAGLGRALPVSHRHVLEPLVRDAAAPWRAALAAVDASPPHTVPSDVVWRAAGGCALAGRWSVALTLCRRAAMTPGTANRCAARVFLQQGQWAAAAALGDRRCHGRLLPRDGPPLAVAGAWDAALAALSGDPLGSASPHVAGSLPGLLKAATAGVPWRAGLKVLEWACGSHGQPPAELFDGALKALGQRGLLLPAVRLLVAMVNAGHTPTEMHYTAVLEACAGGTDKAAVSAADAKAAHAELLSVASTAADHRVLDALVTLCGPTLRTASAQSAPQHSDVPRPAAPFWTDARKTALARFAPALNSRVVAVAGTVVPGCVVAALQTTAASASAELEARNQRTLRSALHQEHVADDGAVQRAMGLYAALLRVFDAAAAEAFPGGDVTGHHVASLWFRGDGGARRHLLRVHQHQHAGRSRGRPDAPVRGAKERCVPTASGAPGADEQEPASTADRQERDTTAALIPHMSSLLSAPLSQYRAVLQQDRRLAHYQHPADLRAFVQERRAALLLDVAKAEASGFVEPPREEQAGSCPWAAGCPVAGCRPAPASTSRARGGPLFGAAVPPFHSLTAVAAEPPSWLVATLAARWPALVAAAQHGPSAVSSFAARCAPALRTAAPSGSWAAAASNAACGALLVAALRHMEARAGGTFAALAALRDLHTAPVAARRMPRAAVAQRAVREGFDVPTPVAVARVAQAASGDLATAVGDVRDGRVDAAALVAPSALWAVALQAAKGGRSPDDATAVAVWRQALALLRAPSD